MKIDQFNKIFDSCSQEMQQVLRGPCTQEISKEEILKNLFGAVKRDAFIPDFMKTLQKSDDGTAKRIFGLFHTKVAHYSGQDVEAFKKLVEEHRVQKPDVPYGKFPKESCFLKDMKAKASFLRAEDHKEAYRLMKEFDTQFKEDPVIQSHNFGVNLVGKDRNEEFINANNVQVGKHSQFILAACPKNTTKAAGLFEVAIQKGTRLFVSTLESHEGKEKCNNFWKNEQLSQMPFRNGLKIVNVGMRVLAEKGKAQIIESDLVATFSDKEVLLKHLHYEGWVDRSALPDEELFQLLLDRIEELQEGVDAPFEINCHGGVGRTGTTAISYYLRKEIDAELASGKSLDEIAFNIPEIHYQFRKQRNGFLGQATQLANVYAVLGEYYERIKLQHDLLREISTPALANTIFLYGKAKISKV